MIPLLYRTLDPTVLFLEQVLATPSPSVPSSAVCFLGVGETTHFVKIINHRYLNNDEILCFDTRMSYKAYPNEYFDLNFNLPRSLDRKIL